MSDVEIVKQLYEAFTNRDVRTVLRFLDESVEWGQPDTLPWGGLYQGPQQVLDFFNRVSDHIDQLTVEVDEYLEANGSVVVLGWVLGASRHTPARFRVRLAHVWKLRDDKVVWFFNYVDTAALLAALGPG